MSSNEAQIASKTQQQVFNLIGQSLTELGIKAKERQIENLLKRQKEMAGPLQLLQQDVTKHPDHYHVLFLEHGNAEDLKALFKENDIAYLEMDPSVIDHNSGGFIISDTDYKMIKNDPRIHITHRYTQKQLEEQGLDENGQDEQEREEEAEQAEKKTKSKDKKEKETKDKTANKEEKESAEEELSEDKIKENKETDELEHGKEDESEHDEEETKDKEAPEQDEVEGKEELKEAEQEKAGEEKEPEQEEDLEHELKESEPESTELEQDQPKEQGEIEVSDELEEHADDTVLEYEEETAEPEQEISEPEQETHEPAEAEEYQEPDQELSLDEDEIISDEEPALDEQETEVIDEQEQEIPDENIPEPEPEADTYIDENEVADSTPEPEPEQEVSASEPEIEQDVSSGGEEWADTSVEEQYDTAPEPEQPVQEQFEVQDDNVSQDYYENEQASSSDYEDQTYSDNAVYEDTYETPEVPDFAEDNIYENPVYEDTSFEQNASTQYVYEDIPKPEESSPIADTFSNNQEYQEQPSQDSSWNNTQQEENRPAFQEQENVQSVQPSFTRDESAYRPQEQPDNSYSNLSGFSQQNESPTQLSGFSQQNEGPAQSSYISEPVSQPSAYEPTRHVEPQQTPSGSVLTGSISSLTQEQAQEAANSSLESALTKPESPASYAPSQQPQPDVGSRLSSRSNVASAINQAQSDGIHGSFSSQQNDAAEAGKHVSSVSAIKQAQNEALINSSPQSQKTEEQKVSKLHGSQPQSINKNTQSEHSDASDSAVPVYIPGPGLAAITGGGSGPNPPDNYNTASGGSGSGPNPPDNYNIASGGDGSGPNPPDNYNISSGPGGNGPNPPDDERDKQNIVVPPVVPVSPMSTLGSGTMDAHTKYNELTPGLSGNDVYVSDDVLLDSREGRGREMLNNAVYNATIGNGVDEAKGEGRKRAGQMLNSLAGGEAGLAGLKRMQTNLNNTLSADEIRTISILMQVHGAKTGMGGGLDFGSVSNIEKSFDDLNSFLNSSKLAYSHSAMRISGSLAADAKMEYGRQKFGREGLRDINGNYITKGDYATNYEYAAKYFKQLQAERNKGLKASDPNFLSDKQVEQLLKTLTDKDGKNVQKLLSSYENFKLGQSMRSGKGGQKLFSINPLNNAAVQKALAEDETAQALQKPKTFVSYGMQARKAGLTLTKVHNEREALRLAKEQTAQSARIAELKKAGKVKTQEYQDAIGRAKELAKKKKLALDNKLSAEKKLKAQSELKRNAKTKVKDAVTKKLNKSELGKHVLSRASAVQNIRVQIIQRFQQSLLGKLVGGANALRQLIMKKLLAVGIKFIGVFASFMFFVLKILFVAALIGGLLDLITMFTLGNNNLEDDPAWGDIEATIMGSVFEQLTLSEAEWANYLKYELFEIKNPVWLDELDGRYTAWLPDGTIDWDHFHMSTEEYITEIVGTDYAKQPVGWFGNKTSSIAKGPEPFPGAPEGSNTPDDPGAYKWIRLLDGSIEVRFRGVGSAAGRTSNIKEIMAMTAVVHMESHLVTEEIDDDGYAEIENASAWERLGRNLKKFWDVVTDTFNAIGNAIGEGFQKLLRTIPAYDEWWQNQIAKQKTQTYMLYAAPLFEYSHTEEYSLQMVLKPTLKTKEDWETLHPEEAFGDHGEVDTGYGWGTMCSGITDQTRASYRRNHELNSAGTDYQGEHDGYGCMEFNEFAFKYDSDQDMYFDDVLAPQVKASWDVDNPRDICVAPGNDGKRWLQVTRDYGHDGCWVFVNPHDIGWHRASPNHEYGHAAFIDRIAGGNKGYVNISSGDGGNTYVVEVAVDTEERGLGTYHDDYDDNGFAMQVEDTETWSHIVTYTFAHSCKGEHTGYYCGGHFNTIVTGTIYHMTVPQLEYNEDAFEEKYVDAEKLREYEDEVEALGYDLDACYNDEGQLLRHFHLMYDNDTKEPFLVNYVGIQKEEPSNQAMDACRDLFDIDCSYTHRYGHVNIQVGDTIASFFGWDYAAMNAAVTKLEDDWYELYNIIPPETIGGTEGGMGSAKGLATALEKGQVVEALAALDEMYANDPSWPARRKAVETALQYVGKVAYAQSSHGTALADGSLNDCSGYVSQCWKDVLHQNYTTASFYNTFHPTKWDNNIKPGDIILHYDGKIADGSGDHALIYIGKDPVTGQDMSVDCTGSGTHYRSRGDTYYHNAFYINMSEVMGH